MKIVINTFILTAALSGCMMTAKSQVNQFYEEDVKSSNAGRALQVKELDNYIKTLGLDRTRLNSIFKPDYSSVRAYERSTAKLRQTLRESIGYPPPGLPEADKPTFRLIGDDSIGTYYRTSFSVVPGVHVIGVFIIPKGLKGKAPLIISMHGGGGSPEVALFHGGSNYHDMVRGGVKNGYIVWAPQHLFFAEGYSPDIRNQIDARLRLVGTTITAVEIAKIARGLDVILKRPEVDSKRVGMVGLSYGGYYTLITTALEPRIKAAVSSCYFGVQDWRYEKNELGIPSDFQFMNAFTLIKDSEICALICPRALEIQAGSKDAASHREGGRVAAPIVARHYGELGIADKFRFVVFEGGHEFWDATAWEWMRKHL